MSTLLGRREVCPDLQLRSSLELKAFLTHFPDMNFGAFGSKVGSADPKAVDADFFDFVLAFCKISNAIPVVS